MDTTKDTRTTRGIKLFKERGDEITRILPHTYSVPSCTGTTAYVVRLAPRVRCECPDHERHPEFTCKHIVAATIKRAKTRARRRSA